MSFLAEVGKFFKHLGSSVVAGLGYANAKGLTDEVVAMALAYVKEAAVTTLTNPEKRDQVEAKVAAVTHLPESVVALAVQIAVMAFKAGK